MLVRGGIVVAGLVLIVALVARVAFFRGAPTSGAMVYGRVVTTGTATRPGTVMLDSGRLVRAQVELTPAEAATLPAALRPNYRVGDRVQVSYQPHSGGIVDYTVADWQRGPALLWLLALFLIVVVLVGRMKGLRAVLGTAACLAIIVGFIVPVILSGANPVLIALLGSGGILALSMYFVHGLNWKTTAALMGTIVTVMFALGVGDLFLHMAHVTSFGDEQSLYITVGDGRVSLQGLVLAGVVIGALGALVDVTVSQASTVAELAHLGPRLRVRQLYSRAMNVGLDHIGSLVNTLVLAYVSSALPLFLLLAMEHPDWQSAVNLELVAQEVIHTLVGAIALVLAVPFTTLIAALTFRGDRHDAGAPGGHSHAHGHAYTHASAGARVPVLDAEIAELPSRE